MKRIILIVMMLSTTDKAKKNIAFVILLLLTAVYCRSIDVSCDAFSKGGSISSTGCISVSHSLIASESAAVRNDQGSRGQQQNLDETSPASDLLSRLARKVLPLFGSGNLYQAGIHISWYFLFICISGCLFYFFLTLVRYIHLKDGNK